MIINQNQNDYRINFQSLLDTYLPYEWGWGWGVMRASLVSSPCTLMNAFQMNNFWQFFERQIQKKPFI